MRVLRQGLKISLLFLLISSFSPFAKNNFSLRSMEDPVPPGLLRTMIEWKVEAGLEERLRRIGKTTFSTPDDPVRRRYIRTLLLGSRFPSSFFKSPRATLPGGRTVPGGQTGVQESPLGPDWVPVGLEEGGKGGVILAPGPGSSLGGADDIQVVVRPGEKGPHVITRIPNSAPQQSKGFTKVGLEENPLYQFRTVDETVQAILDSGIPSIQFPNSKGPNEKNIQDAEADRTFLRQSILATFPKGQTQSSIAVFEADGRIALSGSDFSMLEAGHQMYELALQKRRFHPFLLAVPHAGFSKRALEPLSLQHSLGLRTLSVSRIHTMEVDLSQRHFGETKSTLVIRPPVSTRYKQAAVWITSAGDLVDNPALSDPDDSGRMVLGLAAPKLGGATAWLWSLLVVLGLVVGFLNVSGKETKEFLWVTIGLVVVAFAGSAQISSWSNVQFIGPYLKGIFDSLLAFVVPASVVVALKEVWELAKGTA